MSSKRKLIDLPKKTENGLMVLGALEGMKLKPYIEKVLIEHEAANMPEIKQQKRTPAKAKNGVKK